MLGCGVLTILMGRALGLHNCMTSAEPPFTVKVAARPKHGSCLKPEEGTRKATEKQDTPDESGRLDHVC